MLRPNRLAWSETRCLPLEKDAFRVDIVGPLSISKNMTYLFTIADRFTQWPEAIPMYNASAESCARVLIRHWIAKFGVPNNLVSNRGPQFTCNLSSASKQYDRTIPSAVQVITESPTDHPQNWMDELPLVSEQAGKKTQIALQLTWCMELAYIPQKSFFLLKANTISLLLSFFATPKIPCVQLP